MKSITAAFTNMRRSPYQSLLVILMISLTFIVGYALSFVIYVSNNLLQNIESQPQVVAFFKLDTPKQKLETIKKQIENLSYTKTVILITQEQALKLYKKENNDEPLLLELVTADILPASIEVSTYKIDDLAKIKTVLSKIDVIDDVVYQQDIINTLSRTIKTIKVIGFTTVVILASISFMTIAVIIALKISNQKRTIGIMRLLGASRTFIRKPYVIEGAFYGFISSLIGWSVISTLIFFGLPQMKTMLKVNFPLVISVKLLLIYLVTGSLIGIFFGAFASLVAVNRLIKK